MKRSLALFALVVALAPYAWSQGRGSYFNVESPPVHPIEVFRLGNHDYLAVASTRDSTVEIFDTDETVPAANRRLARIRVGLEPVSVRWNTQRSSLYTANFLGDSVSVITVSAPSGAASFAARLEQTTFVGDEPMDVAFYRRSLLTPLSAGRAVPAPSFQDTVFITHMALDGYDWRDASAFTAVQGVVMDPAMVTTLFDADGNGSAETPISVAAKEPRTVLVRNGKLLILAAKGGRQLSGFDNIDLDLFCDSITTLGTAPLKIGGLGSAGFNMAFDAAGNLFVVGLEARNLELAGEANVKNAETGFTKSMLWRVANPCSGTPSIQRRDLNVATNGLGADTPVAKSEALAFPTDVVVFPTATLPKIFFAAFSSDRVGVLDVDATLSDPRAWPRRKIELAPIAGSTNPLAGPRGLALKTANPSQPNDPGARIYVLNHLDTSIATIDPLSETEVPGGDLDLLVDPRPADTVAGQRFLYDAELSGNGFVSCSSCHHDGRTDRLVWDLSDGQSLAIPPSLKDATNTPSNWPADKGPLMTQSLQGLLNFDINPLDQFWTTNAPYHWRADRADFTAFLPAFNSLLGMAPGTEPSSGDMDNFEEFINTVHYPPNPEQAKDRRPTGVWDNGSGIGTLGSRGLQLYHQADALNNPANPITCAHCHALPEGSNNRITETMTEPNLVPTTLQPAETAALRGLLQFNAKRDAGPANDPASSPYSGLEGLFHTGMTLNQSADPFNRAAEFNLTASINGFNKFGFSDNLCGIQGDFCADLVDLNRILHEFDWGVGPLVGCPVTAKSSNVAQLKTSASTASCELACGSLAATLRCMEQEAGKANSGVAVQALLASGGGFVYDPRLQRYVPEGSSGSNLSRDELLDLVVASTDRLVFQAVPLGSERRIAAADGDPDTPAASAPTSLRLLPLVPNSFYSNVPSLSGSWATHRNGARHSSFVHSLRLFQWGLIQDAPTTPVNGFGFGTGLHHDAPRRFQVSGQGIRHGAVLLVGYWDSPTGGPPNPSAPLDVSKLRLLGFPLFATQRTDPDNSNAPIYETAIELEPLFYYGLMLGGPHAPGVFNAFSDIGYDTAGPVPFLLGNNIFDQPPVGTFDPIAWNQVHIWVANGPTLASLGVGGWHRLTVQP